MNLSVNVPRRVVLRSSKDLIKNSHEKSPVSKLNVATPSFLYQPSTVPQACVVLNDETPMGPTMIVPVPSQSPHPIAGTVSWAAAGWARARPAMRLRAQASVVLERDMAHPLSQAVCV